MQRKYWWILAGFVRLKGREPHLAALGARWLPCMQDLRER